SLSGAGAEARPAQRAGIRGPHRPVPRGRTRRRAGGARDAHDGKRAAAVRAAGVTGMGNGRVLPLPGPRVRGYTHPGRAFLRAECVAACFLVRRILPPSPPVFPMTDEAVIRSFPLYQGPGDPAFVTDFLGTRTRTAFVAPLATLGGLVEGYPIPMNFHATAIEWAGSLRAVLASRGEFVAVELGAGWAPWLVTLARAARLKGIEKVRLVGVEGSRHHCEFMHSHFTENGLDPRHHTLLHGVVGTRDGVAEFPLLADPAGDWGSKAIYRPALRRIISRGYRAIRAAARRLLRGSPGPASHT